MLHRPYMVLIILVIISIMGLEIIQSWPSAVQNNFWFRNCNNTEVPIFFNKIDIGPDPLVILREHWLPNMTFDILVTKLITRMEVIFSFTLWTDEGQTELCYLLGDRCYVPDGCKYVNETALFTHIPCPLKPGVYKNNLHANFTPYPVIVRGKYTIHMSLREEGKPIGCLEFTVCLNKCDYNSD